MSHATEVDPLEHQIAEDQMQYLRENPELCAKGSVNVWVWVRYNDSEWRAVNRERSEHRLRTRMRGTVLTEDDALRWFLTNPVTLIPAEGAGTQGSIWNDVDEQGVFEDVTRCFYCGVSENAVELTSYRTTEQGECTFCNSCRSMWDDAGEIETVLDPAT